MNKQTKEKEVCVGHSVDGEVIKELKDSLYEEKDLEQLSIIFKTLSDFTRLKIIYILSKSPLCVCDIANILEMTQSAISHQLRLLRDLNLVKYERRGKLMVYSLDDDHVLRLFNQGLNHVRHK